MSFIDNIDFEKLLEAIRAALEDGKINKDDIIHLVTIILVIIDAILKNNEGEKVTAYGIDLSKILEAIKKALEDGKINSDDIKHLITIILAIIAGLFSNK